MWYFFRILYCLKLNFNLSFNCLLITKESAARKNKLKGRCLSYVYKDQGSQTRGPHVARLMWLCGPGHHQYFFSYT